jgi:SAM-dependent methyltransferase
MTTPADEAPTPHDLARDTPELTILLSGGPTKDEALRLLSPTTERLRRDGVLYELVVTKNGSEEDSDESPLPLVRGRHVMWVDGDLPVTDDVFDVLWRARTSADIVIGRRPVIGFARRIEDVFDRARRWILSLPANDLSSPFRIYRRTAVLSTPTFGRRSTSPLDVLLAAFLDGRSLAETTIAGSAFRSPRRRRWARSLCRQVLALPRQWVKRSSIEAADYDDRARRSRHPFQRFWQKRRTERLARWAESGRKRVDIGCGSSAVVQSLEGTIGLDLRRNKLRFLRRRGVAVVQGDVFRLPFRDGAFDVVICSQLIEHVPNTPELWRELTRIVAPRGELLVGTPDYGRPWWPFIESIYKLVHPQGYADEHITHYTLDTLASTLSNAGFEIIERDYILGAELNVRARRPNRAEAHARR